MMSATVEGRAVEGRLQGGGGGAALTKELIREGRTRRMKRIFVIGTEVSGRIFRFLDCFGLRVVALAQRNAQLRGGIKCGVFVWLFVE